MKTTTWDGLAASTVPPFGTAVFVFRRTDGGLVEVLLLHRAHNAPDYDGDWAWTPPTGCRFPDEAIRDCAIRELYEEAGLRATIDFSENFGDDDWHMYRAEVSPGTHVSLIDPEHDEFEWLSATEALRRCRPEIIRRPLARALASVV